MFKKLSLFFLILLGLFFRLSSFPAIHDDIISNAGWGQWIGTHGPMGFYDNQIWTFAWPTQPPLVNLLYGASWHLYLTLLESLRSFSNTIVTFHLAPGKMLWFFEFTKSFDKLIAPGVPFPLGFIYSIKLFPFIADIFITFLLYKFSKKAIFPILYWCLPFSGYLSSAWGQYDQISFLFLLLSFLSLKKNWIVSLLLLFISLNLKPTGLLFLPFFVYLTYKVKPFLKHILAGLFLAIFSWFILVSTFTPSPVLNYSYHTIYPKIFLKSEPRLTTNSLNFWHIFVGDKALNQATPILGIPAYFIGFLIYLVLFIYLIRITPGQYSHHQVFLGLTLLGIGGWLFMTNMLERYIFTGLVTLLFLSIKKPKLIYFYLILSTVFFFNLFKFWWFPSSLTFLKDLFSYTIFSRSLSLLNFLTFIFLFRKLRD